MLRRFNVCSAFHSQQRISLPAQISCVCLLSFSHRQILCNVTLIRFQCSHVFVLLCNKYKKNQCTIPLIEPREPTDGFPHDLNGRYGHKQLQWLPFINVGILPWPQWPSEPSLTWWHLKDPCLFPKKRKNKSMLHNQTLSTPTPTRRDYCPFKWRMIIFCTKASGLAQAKELDSTLLLCKNIYFHAVSRTICCTFLCADMFFFSLRGIKYNHFSPSIAKYRYFYIICNKVLVRHYWPTLLLTQSQRTRSVFQLAASLKPNDTPLYIYLRPPKEGASVFLFVRWAKGISRTPPDSHCCNWVVAMSPAVPSKASGNSRSARKNTTLHMLRGGTTAAEWESPIY